MDVITLEPLIVDIAKNVFISKIAELSTSWGAGQT